MHDKCGDWCPVVAKRTNTAAGQDIYDGWNIPDEKKFEVKSTQKKKNELSVIELKNRQINWQNLIRD